LSPKYRYLPSQRNSSSCRPKCLRTVHQVSMGFAFLGLKLEYLSEYVLYGKLRLNNEVYLSENEDEDIHILYSVVTQDVVLPPRGPLSPIQSRLVQLPHAEDHSSLGIAPLSDVHNPSSFPGIQVRAPSHQSSSHPPRILFSSPSFSHPSVHNSITFHLFPISIPISITTELQLRSPDPNMSTRKRKQDEELVALPSDESEEEEE
jgi:hypothetical protein